MDDDTQKHSDQFDASLPLPLDDSHPSADIKHKEETANPAADLIRRKVEAAYSAEPNASTESKDLSKLKGKIERSKHQQFIYELTNSGRPLHEIQIAWHEYYAALTDKQKHEVWQEFYATHAQASHLTSAIPGMVPAKERADESIVSYNTHLQRQPRSDFKRHVSKLHHHVKRALPAKERTHAKPSPFKSLAFGLGAGSIFLVIFLFSFFNERFIAPFIQPSRTVTNTPIISGQTISSAPEVIIPKINVEIPVVYDVASNDDNTIETALERGVVHYADTAVPGQNGNVVIVGHSSNNIFNPGKYKFAFVLLSHLDNGDSFYLQKDGKRYTYQVYKKEIVSPTDVSVLGPADKPATATLITCDPPGTSTNRLVVSAEQIDPSPTANVAQAAPAHLATQSAIIPGNAPTLWSRLWKWLTY